HVGYVNGVVTDPTRQELSEREIDGRPLAVAAKADRGVELGVRESLDRGDQGGAQGTALVEDLRDGPATTRRHRRVVESIHVEAGAASVLARDGFAGERPEPAEVGRVERGDVSDEVVHRPRGARHMTSQLLGGQRAGEALQPRALLREAVDRDLRPRNHAVPDSNRLTSQDARRRVPTSTG